MSGIIVYDPYDEIRAGFNPQIHTRAKSNTVEVLTRV